MHLFLGKAIESYAARRAFRFGLAIFFAMLVDHYYSSAHQFWGILAALVTLHVPLGAPLRQNLLHYFVVFLSVLISALMLMTVPQPILFYSLASVGCVVVWLLLALSYGVEAQFLTIPLILALILLIGFFAPPMGADLLVDRIHDVTFGTAVGLIINLTVFPEQIDRKFQRNSIAYYRIVENFFTEIMQKFLLNDSVSNLSSQQMFKAQYNLLPFWTLQPGFNPRLGKSHHYFLANTIQLSETLFALDALSILPVEPAMLEIFHDSLEKYKNKTHELFKVLLAKLENKSNIDIQFATQDFMDEVIALEDLFKEKVSPNLEALALSKEYIDLADVIRDLKAIRLILIRLVESVLS